MLPALLLAATLIVVGLLIVVLFRMGARFDALRSELERLRVVQRDMSSDVRARLDEGARTWESVEAEVRPRLDQLEPSVADLSAALEENLPALSGARARLEDVESRVAETEARVALALEAGTQDTEERFERIEGAVRTLRNAADERLADLAARVSELETGPAPALPATDPLADNVETQGEAGEHELAGEQEEPVGVGVSSAPSRGTRRGRKPGGGRWVLVLLMLAAGLVIALAQFS